MYNGTLAFLSSGKTSLATFLVFFQSYKTYCHSQWTVNQQGDSLFQSDQAQLVEKYLGFDDLKYELTLCKTEFHTMSIALSSILNIILLLLCSIQSSFLHASNIHEYTPKILDKEADENFSLRY